MKTSVVVWTMDTAADSVTYDNSAAAAAAVAAVVNSTLKKVKVVNLL